MTEAQVRKHVVDTAVKYLGCNEADGSHRKIVDIYNGHKPLARGYAVKYTDAWCATFVSAVSIECGYTDIMFTECGCGAMIDLYKKRNRWKEADNYHPGIGDIVMYDWQDSGKGDNTGAPDHVGIVATVGGGNMKVIEGNKNNAVQFRTLAVNGRYIRGYCLPNYASKSTGAVTDTKTNTVKEVQLWLNQNYSSGLTLDGLHGIRTKTALTRALQKELGVPIDGIYGPQTAAAVSKNNLKKGDKGNLVKVLQAFLVCNGYKEAYVDGSFGKGTLAALEAYQRKMRLKVDGIAGKATFQALCS